MPPYPAVNTELNRKASDHDIDSTTDEFPDSPSTLLGEEADLDEICCPLNVRYSKRYVSETPPRSPPTLAGDGNEIERAYSPSSCGTISRERNVEDEFGSSTAVLGDEMALDEVDSRSPTPELAFSPLIDDSKSNKSENEVKAIHTSPSEPRKYVPWPDFPCGAITLITDWPAFVIEAFIDEGWKFGLDEVGKTVLEVASGREDLGDWFTMVGGEWQRSRLGKE